MSMEAAPAADLGNQRVRERRRAWASGWPGGPQASERGSARRQIPGVEQARGLSALTAPGQGPPSTDPAWSMDATVVERERILRGWSHADLARVAHMDPRTERRLVAGRLRPRLGSVQALCTALGVPLPAVITFPSDAGGPELTVDGPDAAAPSALMARS
jgi:hypothetical protein